MKRASAMLVAAVILTGCGDQGVGVTNTEGLYTSAVEFVGSRTVPLETRGLVYLAWSELGSWEGWCGFVEDAGVREVCGRIRSGEVEAAPLTSDELAEIDAALDPAVGEWVDDVSSVLEPFEEGMMMAPVKNDAGLLVIGSLVTQGDRSFLPVESHGVGWLLEAERTADGWTFTELGSWIA